MSGGREEAHEGEGDFGRCSLWSGSGDFAVEMFPVDRASGESDWGGRVVRNVAGRIRSEPNLLRFFARAFLACAGSGGGLLKIRAVGFCPRGWGASARRRRFVPIPEMDILVVH